MESKTTEKKHLPAGVTGLVGVIMIIIFGGIIRLGGLIILIVAIMQWSRERAAKKTAEKSEVT